MIISSDELQLAFKLTIALLPVLICTMDCSHATSQRSKNLANDSLHIYEKGADQLTCSSKGQEGTCYMINECSERGGTIGENCLNYPLVCCVFTFSCGDVSAEKIVYFNSPDFPKESMGTLACDYDVLIQEDTCALRIEYIKVQLARKLGGICDIDQILILNSPDGPTAGQCGPLSGYVTTVAVNPGQRKPVKLALLVQNEASYLWHIRVKQLKCTKLNFFEFPEKCGKKYTDSVYIRASVTRNLYSKFPNLFSLWNDVKWRRDFFHDEAKWWEFPEPIFNTYYYGSMKKYLQQHSSHFNSMDLEKDKIKERIVGGSEVEEYEFPWVAAIFIKDRFFCGGALINDEYILTAAHCLMTRDTPVEDLIVHLGDHDLTTPNETDHITRGVKYVLFHSHFHPFLLSNDIALLRLNKSVESSHHIRPVCLPKPGEMYTGQKGTVVGWGIIAFPMGEPSPVLQKLEVETLSNHQCSHIIEEPVGLGMICAAPSALQGTCFGDSGGPLTTENADGNDILIGVVSFGVTGCAVIPAFPDLYTRVSEYLKWIDVNAIK